MFARSISGYELRGSEAAMDAWIGRMPAVVIGLFFAATAAAAPDGFAVEQPVIEQNKAVQPTIALPAAQLPKQTKPANTLAPSKISSLPAASQAGPAPPPESPPSDAAPAGAGFAAPTIGDVYLPEAPIVADPPLRLGPSGAIEQREATKVDDSLVIDASWGGGDAGLVTLCGLPSITSLTIKNAPLTDAALDYVAALPNLKRLVIESTHFSAAALAKLQRQRPLEIVIARGKASGANSAIR